MIYIDVIVVFCSNVLGGVVSYWLDIDGDLLIRAMLKVLEIVFLVWRARLSFFVHCILVHGGRVLRDIFWFLTLPNFTLVAFTKNLQCDIVAVQDMLVLAGWQASFYSDFAQFG